MLRIALGLCTGIMHNIHKNIHKADAYFSTSGYIHGTFIGFYFNFIIKILNFINFFEFFHDFPIKVPFSMNYYSKFIKV
jgi:hypothetical protein